MSKKFRSGSYLIENLRKSLFGLKNKTISINGLEQITAPLVQTYEEFAKIVLQLENEGILVMVKSKGRTSRNPSLAFQYRINKSLLAEEFHRELQQYRLLLHPYIHIDTYFSQDPSV
jgi:hypothetical protein